MTKSTPPATAPVRALPHNRHAAGRPHPPGHWVWALVLLGGCFADRSGARPNDPSADAGSDAQVPALDGSSRDAAPPAFDQDEDGINDAIDNCPDTPNPGQEESDGDRIGDACDPDRDGDGISNEIDICPDSDSRTGPDEDGDGIGDACDACPLDPDPGQANDDQDGLGDACEDPDPMRFSRVAYLETFATSLGELSASGNGVDLVDGSVEIQTDPGRFLTRPMSDDHPGERYVVHAVGRYLGGVGFFGDGDFGILLRWTESGDEDFGYRLGVRADNDDARILRHDGIGCGILDQQACEETLLDEPLIAPFGESSTFVLRATAYDNQLTLLVENPVGTSTHDLTDAGYATGGIGLWAREARVRFGAVAVYAP